MDSKKLNLLPSYFNNVGLSIILGTILFAVLSRFQFLNIETDVVQQVSKSLFLIGLLIISLSKKRVEDEITIVVRLKGFTIAFIYGVVTIIVESLFDIISNRSFLDGKNAHELLISMFLFYFIGSYFINKQIRK